MAGYESNTIGNNIQYLRNKAQLDERVVSEFLKMDLDSYIFCENGRKQFNIEQLVELSKLFNIKFSSLIKWPLSDELLAADTNLEYLDSDEKNNQQLINAYQEYVKILNDEIEYFKKLMDR
jgi:DNA-binding XRE family transcriptional regulator